MTMQHPEKQNGTGQHERWQRGRCRCAVEMHARTAISKNVLRALNHTVLARSTARHFDNYDSVDGKHFFCRPAGTWHFARDLGAQMWNPNGDSALLLNLRHDGKKHRILFLYLSSQQWKNSLLLHSFVSDLNAMAVISIYFNDAFCLSKYSVPYSSN